jgi:hypothetical protein
MGCCAVQFEVDQKRVVLKIDEAACLQKFDDDSLFIHQILVGIIKLEVKQDRQS